MTKRDAAMRLLNVKYRILDEAAKLKANSKECKELAKDVVALEIGTRSLIQNWIKVTKNTLPPEGEEVLVLTRSQKGIRNIDKGYWIIDRFIHRGCAEVTHWMPLPELPEVGE